MKTYHTVYPSKIDWWVGLLLICIPVLHITLGTYLLLSHNKSGIITLGIGMFSCLFIFLFCFPCRYTLTPSFLEIRFGLMKKNIKLGEITGAYLSSEPWGASALSLKRIQINSKEGSALISPAHRDDFLQELKERIAEAEPALPANDLHAPTS